MNPKSISINILFLILNAYLTDFLKLADKINFLNNIIIDFYLS